MNINFKLKFSSDEVAAEGKIIIYQKLLSNG